MSRIKHQRIRLPDPIVIEMGKSIENKVNMVEVALRFGLCIKAYL